MRRALLGLALLGVFACDKGKSDPGAAASASAASAAPSASVAAPKVKSNDWKGTYTSERATYSLPAGSGSRLSAASAHCFQRGFNSARPSRSFW